MKQGTLLGLSGIPVLGMLFLVFPRVLAPSPVRPLIEATFNTGDTILTPSIWKGFFMAPYHSIFAINKYELLQSTVENKHPKYGQAIVFVILTLQEFGPNWQKKLSKTIEPNTTSRKTITDKGTILASRMNSMRLPYHFYKCNCRHYTDYLTYGETYGTWYLPWYGPVADWCPVHLKITKDTDVNAKEFSFLDKNGNKFPLNSEWVDPKVSEEMKAKEIN